MVEPDGMDNEQGWEGPGIDVTPYQPQDFPQSRKSTELRARAVDHLFGKSMAAVRLRVIEPNGQRARIIH